MVPLTSVLCVVLCYMIEDTPGHAQDKTESKNPFREENQQAGSVCHKKT